MQPNALYYGDCLDWMEQRDSQSGDLIYLDPPFNSKATYNQLYHKDGAGMRSSRHSMIPEVWDEVAEYRWLKYKDASGLKAHNAICGPYQIHGKCGMLAHLTYMAERLEQMHRLLKDTGSIYLYCDPTASHYLKVIMDGICDNHMKGGGGTGCLSGMVFAGRGAYPGSGDAYRGGVQRMGPVGSYRGESEGLMVRLRPSWGRGHGRSMYRQQTILDAVPLGANTHRTELELRYGIPWRKGTARPVIGVTQLAQGTVYRFGGELRPRKRFTVSVFGITHARAPGGVGLSVRSSLQY